MRVSVRWESVLVGGKQAGGDGVDDHVVARIDHVESTSSRRWRRSGAIASALNRHAAPQGRQ